MIIEEVKVLLKQIVSDRTILLDFKKMVIYLPIGGASSVGALRDRSCLFFDTACSRNDDFDFVPRRLREKLSVCDLLTFRLNILGRCADRDYRQYFVGTHGSHLLVTIMVS